METREIISENDNLIEYKATFGSGKSGIYSCDAEDWQVFLLKKKLVDSGADEKIVEELYQKGYSKGYEEAEFDQGWD